MDTWKNIVQSVAPVLGTALGGPLAGAATKFIADKLLGNPDADESEVQQAIEKASPEQLAKLKEMDEQFKLAMQKLNIDESKLSNQDRAGARQLYKISTWPQISLSAVFVIGYFLVLFFLIENPDTLSKERGIMGVFTTVLGVLTAAIPQILSFWFGSSNHNKQDSK
ncbi:hypothetical protein CBF23_008885 [Marinomonas agarivorans]|nr:hypothetical protein CBF23_008885 [Marinomonas agarivorans]